MEEKRFALLIDSDNVSAEYVQKILDELIEANKEYWPELS